MTDEENAALALIHSGAITITEAADQFGIPQQTLHRWCKLASIDARSQRAAFIRRRCSIALFRRWKLPRNITTPIAAKRRAKPCLSTKT